MRKAWVATGAIPIIGLLVGLVVTATAGSDISSPRTITVVEKESQSHFVDLGRRGPNLGDEFVFSGVLLHSGKRVGHDGGRCTFVHTKPLRGECEATFILPGGKVTAQTLIRFSNGPQRFTIAVNGGTGIYRNARGQATIQDLSGNRSRITFHLIP